MSELPACKSLETGLSPNSGPAKPGLGLVLCRNSEPARTKVWPCPFSELPARVQSSEKELTFFTNSEIAEPGVVSILSQNFEPVRVWSSTKGTGLSPYLPNQGYTRSFLRTSNLLNQGLLPLTQNSELKLQTPGKNTILDHLVLNMLVTGRTNSVDPDQTLHYTMSDLGLHCLPMSQKYYTSLIWVKYKLNSQLSFPH